MDSLNPTLEHADVSCGLLPGPTEMQLRYLSAQYQMMIHDATWVEPTQWFTLYVKKTFPTSGSFSQNAGFLRILHDELLNG